MRRSTAEFLAPRIWPHHVWIRNGAVAADALHQLARGVVWNVTYDAGRLLAEISTSDLLALGEVDLVRASLERHGPDGPLLATLRGDDVDVTSLGEYDHADVLLARRALGLPYELPRTASAEIVASIERQLAHVPTWNPLPPEHRADDDVARLDLYDLMFTGDPEGCERRLAVALAQGPTDPFRIPRLAALCRALTGDDARAMAILERVPLEQVRDDWRAIFGELGEARIQRDKDHVLEVIERAFTDVPFPGRRHRSLFQAEAADNYAGCDQSRDHTGRWQDLPREHILACQFALPHLGAGSLPYYLPALMSFAVREHDRPQPDHGIRWIFESIEYHLHFTPDGRAYAMDRHRHMTREQLAAIACFADYYRCSAEHRASWHAVARGEPWP